MDKQYIDRNARVCFPAGQIAQEDDGDFTHAQRPESLGKIRNHGGKDG